MKQTVTTPINPNDAVDFIIASAKPYAQAKANRIYLEEFRKSKKALLMQKSGSTAIAAKEMDAYADPDYLQLLEGLREAVETEGGLRWRMGAAQAPIEVWRTNEASNRSTDRATR